jgi:hypothetical protein
MEKSAERTLQEKKYLELKALEEIISKKDQEDELSCEEFTKGIIISTSHKYPKKILSIFSR